MAHNPELADKMGVSERNRELIDTTHKVLESLLFEEAVFLKSVYDRVENLEYYLQGLWGFSPDPSKHTWKHRYVRTCNEHKEEEDE